MTTHTYEALSLLGVDGGERAAAEDEVRWLAGQARVPVPALKWWREHSGGWTAGELRDLPCAVSGWTDRPDVINLVAYRGGRRVNDPTPDASVRASVRHEFCHLLERRHGRAPSIVQRDERGEAVSGCSDLAQHWSRCRPSPEEITAVAATGQDPDRDRAACDAILALRPGDWAAASRLAAAARSARVSASAPSSPPPPPAVRRPSPAAASAGARPQTQIAVERAPKRLANGRVVEFRHKMLC